MGHPLRVAFLVGSNSKPDPEGELKMMTAEQAERQADLITFFLHDDHDHEMVEEVVPTPLGPYAPSERALVHTVHTRFAQRAQITQTDVL